MVLPRELQHDMVSRLPLPCPWGQPHPSELEALYAVRRDGVATLPRADRPDIPMGPEHAKGFGGQPLPRVGMARLFGRGLITLVGLDKETAHWGWTGWAGESGALRLNRYRALGFLPYNMGARGLTPDTMSGPELVALLVWHYRATTVTSLDVHRDPDGRVHLTEHTTDKQTTLSRWPHTPAVDNFHTHTRGIDTYRDDSPTRFNPTVVACLLTNLAAAADRQFDHPDVHVDLCTWRVHRSGETLPYSETLHPNVQDALVTLGAPTLTTPVAFLDWAQANLTVPMMCRISPRESVRTGGARKHTLRLDPLTATVSSVPSTNPKQVEELMSIHVMAALSGTPSFCVAATRFWTTYGTASATVLDGLPVDLCLRLRAAALVGRQARETAAEYQCTGEQGPPDHDHDMLPGNP